MSNTSDENASMPSDCLYTTPSNLTRSRAECGEKPFCWPPNGTRICIPSTIEVYWDKNFYDSKSQIDPTVGIAIDPHFMQNRGWWGVFFTNHTFWNVAEAIPGTTKERSAKLLMNERRESGAVIVHEGPTLVLVDTPANTPTPTPSRPPTCLGECSPNFSPGETAGIVIGAIGALVALLFLCRFCNCCGCCVPLKKSEVHKNDRFSTELTKQPAVNEGRAPQVASDEAVMGSRALADQLSRMEEARIAPTRGAVEMESGDPPPKYTP